jgi:transposase-like protein
MPQPTPQQKHSILVHCRSRRAGKSEVDVAAQHGVTVTRETISRWRRRWNGTSQSLQHKSGAGRPRTLTPSEVSRHVRAPILAANRAHKAVSYTMLLPSVQQKTRKKIALRTLRDFGEQQLGVNSMASRKRTSD